MLAHVPSFERNPRGSPDFLAYPVPKACMHVLGTRVPRRLGVVRLWCCLCSLGRRFGFGVGFGVGVRFQVEEEYSQKLQLKANRIAYSQRWLKCFWKRVGKLPHSHSISIVPSQEMCTLCFGSHIC